MPTRDFRDALRASAKDYDLIHLHSLWGPAITLAARESSRAGVPYVISPRGMLQTASRRRNGFVKAAYFELLEKSTVRRARAIHFFNEYEAADSKTSVGDHTETFVVPNGIDLPTTIPAKGGFRAAFPQVAQRRMLLFLGRLHWSKGLDLQLMALQRVLRTRGDVVLVFAGPDGGERRGLETLSQELGIADHVCFTGPLSTVQAMEAIVDADTFLLTSLHEAHSVAMNEALALGTPLVITENICFGLLNEYAAARVVAWDPDALANGITDVLSDLPVASALSAGGRRLATERLAWPKVARAMHSAYERLLSGEKRERTPTEVVVAR